MSRHAVIKSLEPPKGEPRPTPDPWILLCDDRVHLCHRLGAHGLRVIASFGSVTDPANLANARRVLAAISPHARPSVVSDPDHVEVMRWADDGGPPHPQE